MLFNSYSFIVFLIIVFSIYWSFKEQYRTIILLLASYFFYMFSEPKYGILIFVVTLISYSSAIIIETIHKIKKIILFLTISVLVGLLIFFKYFNFFSLTTNSMMNFIGFKSNPVILNIVLPLGISFYIFQSISYVVDVYRGVTNAEHNFLVYATFISFFPKLIAGPIERANNLISQIRSSHAFNYDKAMYGIKLMIWGFYKKLVIADNLHEYVKKVFDSPYDFKGFSLILATLFFTLQIYCDFSGYSDIAIGTAKLFGFDLITNFKSPYFASSIREFWHRWHISLSTWFRDYVYIPLGGNRKGNLRKYINLIITFLLSGLWHGESWTFVIWGFIHGIAQVIEDIVLGKKNTNSIIVQIIRSILVFVFCMFSWIFFVSHSIKDAFYVILNCLNGIVNPINYIYDGFKSIGFNKVLVLLFGFFILIMFVYDFISVKRDFVKWISSKNYIFQWLFYIAIGLIVIFFSKKGVAAEFIYFQF